MSLKWICSKHDKIMELSNVKGNETLKELTDTMSDIYSLASDAKTDGEKMEKGLNEKKDKIESLEKELEEARDCVSALKNELKELKKMNQSKFKLAMDKAFQKERPSNNLVSSASRDYDIPLHITHDIFEKDSDPIKFYENLESYIKERSKT